MQNYTNAHSPTPLVAYILHLDIFFRSEFANKQQRRIYVYKKKVYSSNSMDRFFSVVIFNQLLCTFALCIPFIWAARLQTIEF